MSSFLSNKFLLYRKGLSGPPKPIDIDLFCTTCGYNLRGLTYGRNCPECGTQIRKNTGLKDVLLDGDIPQRHNMKWGLALLTTALIATAITYLFSFVWMVFFPSSANVVVIGGINIALSIALAAGAWLSTPKRLDSHYYRWRALRVAGRYSQLCWVPASMCWLLGATSTSTADEWLGVATWLRLAGYTGAVCLLLVLHRLAVDAELDVPARRINLSLWMLPIPSLLLEAVPDQVFWVGMILIGPVVLVWCWYVLLLGRGVLAMQRHVGWSLRLAEDAPLRFKRIEETRRELDAAVQAQIRPSGATLQDVPLATNQPKK